MKFCTNCLIEIDTKDGENLCDACLEAEDKFALKRERIKRARRARHQALTDLGLKRVKGAMGGTYYE